MRCPLCHTEAAHAPSWVDRWHVRQIAVLACALGVAACLWLCLSGTGLAVLGVLGLALFALCVQSSTRLRFHRCAQCRHEFPVAD